MEVYGVYSHNWAPFIALTMLKFILHTERYRMNAYITKSSQRTSEFDHLVCNLALLYSSCHLRPHHASLRKKATIHQVTTMLSTSKNVLSPCHNHLLTTGTDEPSLADAQVIIKMSGCQYQWLAGGYNLEIGHF